MLLKRQNEQEVQIRLVGYRCRISRTKTTTLGKRMKPTVCITAQHKSGTMIDFKLKEDAENMLIPSTVGSFTLTKSSIPKKSQIR